MSRQAKGGISRPAVSPEGLQVRWSPNRELRGTRCHGAWLGKILSPHRKRSAVCDVGWDAPVRLAVAKSRPDAGADRRPAVAPFAMWATDRKFDSSPPSPDARGVRGKRVQWNRPNLHPFFERVDFPQPPTRSFAPEFARARGGALSGMTN